MTRASRDYRVLFVQPRYHTNTHPMVRALKNAGMEVKHVSQTANEGEHYSALRPEVLGYSSVFELIAKAAGYQEHSFGVKWGWPPLRKFRTVIREFEPDIIVTKGYTIYSLSAIVFGKLHGAGTVLYVQIPSYEPEEESNTWNWLHDTLFGYPLVRITPIRGNEDGYRSPGRYYLPFTVDLSLASYEKPEGPTDGPIEIMSIGKFGQERKNHRLLLDAVASLRSEYDLRLTLIGHTYDERKFHELREYIREHGYDEFTSVHADIPYEDVMDHYARSDLYVLPSSDEPAAVSHLEAMAHGLPVICSDTNGTRYYVEDGDNGFVFTSDDREDLSEKLEWIVADRQRLTKMGRRSREIVESEYHPERFAERFVQIVAENFELE